MRLLLNNLKQGKYNEDSIRSLIDMYGTDSRDWFRGMVVYNNIGLSYGELPQMSSSIAPDYWKMISSYVELSEEFLTEYDRYVNKREIMTLNYRTCRNLSLNYLISNFEYIEDIEMFEQLSDNDYNFLKQLHELKK